MRAAWEAGGDADGRPVALLKKRLLMTIRMTSMGSDATSVSGTRTGMTHETLDRTQDGRIKPHQR